MVFPIIDVILIFPGGQETISDERDKIRDAIFTKVRSLKTKISGYTNNYRFAKLSKQTKIYVTSELRDLVDGDQIRVNFVDADAKSPIMLMFDIENLVQKIKCKRQLSGLDRENIYNFLSVHGDYCCGQQSNAVDNYSKKRKVDESPRQVDESPKQVDESPRQMDESQSKELKKYQDVAVQTEQILENKRIQVGSNSNSSQSTNKNTRNECVQCDYSISTLAANFVEIENYLKETFKKPRKSWTEQQCNKFSTAFRFAYPLRRVLVMSDNPPTAQQIKELHPYLFHKNQVFKEFELVTDKDNLFKRFRRNVKLYSSLIVEHCNHCKLKKIVLNHIDDSDDRNLTETIGSLLLLPNYIEENEDNRKGIILFKNEELLEDHDERPYIDCSGNLEQCLKFNTSFKVYVDNVELCVMTDLIEAYFALLAAYYIFNAVYPDCAFRTFSCLERLFIEHSDVEADSLDDSVEEKIKLLQKYGSRKKGQSVRKS